MHEIGPEPFPPPEHEIDAARRMLRSWGLAIAGLGMLAVIVPFLARFVSNAAGDPLGAALGPIALLLFAYAPFATARAMMKPDADRAALSAPKRVARGVIAIASVCQAAAVAGFVIPPHSPMNAIVFLFSSILASVLGAGVVGAARLHARLRARQR